MLIDRREITSSDYRRK
ncbi:Protein of unknown function [Pyronema omphalodes CBS 100304]|uniref:Uncharacterized protein n=1 Tax=Pyronema omphalodes (strain CBS 100304) TaxID=1076935 RepID=U4LQA3_PYROM|nr:Protein of unknown function [Pyronema omphalodes CBS 100304]